jgi:hypothetical protein
MKIVVDSNIVFSLNYSRTFRVERQGNEPLYPENFRLLSSTFCVILRMGIFLLFLRLKGTVYQ